ncbi:MAG: polysaccharide deacetylase family protein [Bacteroidetes bacterium]|nr:polysaccharide deacetylase family protein [Bacteroidota bacterium]
MVRNFLFHRVSPERDLLWDPMDVKRFDQCISFISKHFEVVLLEDLMGQEKIDSKKKYASICFDDGFKDNIEYAAPILKKHQCKASFYVVTNSIEENIPTWTYMLDYRFQKTDMSRLELKFDFLPQAFSITELPTSKDRRDFAIKLKPFLKKLEHEKRELVLQKIAESFSDVLTPKIMMNWEDLIELKRQGHYIGSHSAHHSMLGTMKHEEDVWRELADSAEMIEKKMGYFPVSISYPVGSYNEMTIALSKKVGYTMGLAVRQDEFHPERDNRFEIPRIELYNEPYWKMYLRMTHILENFKKLVKYR